MSEPAGAAEDAGAQRAPSAGALLREARTAQGVPIDELAAVLKVAPRKIEALEADRIAELPDIAFARALARSVCRHLKTDPAPVLACMPLPRGHRLEPSGAAAQRAGERLGRAASGPRALVARPVVWGPGIIMLAALALYFVPSGTRLPPSQGPAPAASAVAPEVPAPVEPAQAPPAPAAAAAPVAQTLHSAPPASAPESAAAEAPLVLRTTAASWIGVVDAKGRTLLARTVHPGETVAIDVTAPLTVRVGNAAATRITFRGQAVELPRTRENIARIELK